MQPYVRRLKPNSQILRKNQTPAERKLWQRIRNDQLLGFRFNRQKPLLNYIVDFYCTKARLVIELDGSQHYEQNHQENARLRDQELNNLGLTVLRFDNRQIMLEIDNVVEEIYQFLNEVE